jgi:hypothetical protein
MMTSIEGPNLLREINTVNSVVFEGLFSIQIEQATYGTTFLHGMSGDNFNTFKTKRKLFYLNTERCIVK